MESRLPTRKIAVSTNDIAKRIAANHLKFGEAFPRMPMTIANPENPPLYQSVRSRALSPDARRRVDLDRHHLRRSRSISISDLSHSNIVSLKRGAAVTIESIPAKIARTNFPTKRTTSTVLSSFKRPARPGAVGSSTATNSIQKTEAVAAKPTAAKPTAAKPTAAKPTVAKPTVAKPTAVKSTVAAKVAVKRIPSYDFKARYNDLVEKHKIVKEKLQPVQS